MTRLALLIACLLLVAASPARAASEGHAPPGNAAIDEYVEDVPDSEGERPFGAGGSGGAAGGGQGAEGSGRSGGGPVLDEKTRARLGKLGKDGYRVAALADQTAPRGGDGQSGGGSAGGAAGVDGGGDLDGSRVAASAEALNGDAPGGMGNWLLVLLAATAVAAIAAGVLSRRRA